MKKRILCLIVCAIMLISAFVIPSSAASKSFIDVKSNDWFAEAVNWCVDHGYFSGVGTNTFAPNMAFSRAQIVTVLSRVANADVSAFAKQKRFSDVPVGEWYAAAVNWANENGIVAGMSDGTFHPTDAVTREQVCVIFAAYLKYAKLRLPYKTEMKDFDDVSSISQWAYDAVESAVMSGLISGNDKNQVMPKANCLRSMAVVMIRNFVQSLETASPLKDPFIVAYYNASQSLYDPDIAYVDVINYHPFTVTYSNYPFIVDSLSSLLPKVRENAAKYGNEDIKIVLTVANNNINTFESCLAPYSKGEEFADALVEKVKNYGYDGIDIDYEFPQSQSIHENFVRFMRHAREGLDKLSEETGKEYILSMAVPGTQWAWSLFDMDALKDIVSYFNIMNYDTYAERGFALHHTSPYDNALIPGGSVASDIALYLKNGIPAEKIAPGCGLYSRKWTGVEAGDNPDLPGLYQPGKNDTNSYLHYSVLASSYINKHGYVRYWDDNAKAPYLYNKNTKEFFSYDDPESVSYKVDLVKKYGIGGIMLFDYCTCDGVKMDDDRTFLNYFHDIVKN